MHLLMKKFFWSLVQHEEIFLKFDTTWRNISEVWYNKEIVWPIELFYVWRKHVLQILIKKKHPDNQPPFAGDPSVALRPIWNTKNILIFFMFCTTKRLLEPFHFHMSWETMFYKFCKKQHPEWSKRSFEASSFLAKYFFKIFRMIFFLVFVKRFLELLIFWIPNTPNFFWWILIWITWYNN